MKFGSDCSACFLDLPRSLDMGKQKLPHCRTLCFQSLWDGKLAAWKEMPLLFTAQDPGTKYKTLYGPISGLSFFTVQTRKSSLKLIDIVV